MSDPYDLLARFYDLVAVNDDRDIDLFISYAERLDAPTLELGAGSGRVVVPLAARAIAITGIDRSEEMLRIARARCAAAGVTARLVQAEVTGYRFAERFGLIVSAADSFLHLETAADQLAALRLAREHLLPNGRLLLDLPALGAGGWDDWQPGARAAELVWSGIGPDGALLQHFQSYASDPATQVRRVTHLFDEFENGGSVRRTTVSYRLRFIFPGELPLLAGAAGLAVDDLYGDYDLRTYTSGCDRMIAVLRPG